jgi:hypothetical protein
MPRVTSNLTDKPNGEYLMSNNHLIMQQRATLPADDGWNDAANEAGERSIRGTLLKFADWRWTAGKEATPIKDGTQLVALATTAMWVRWENARPAEYRMRQTGKRLPERDELGHDNEDEWEEGPDGKVQDPWRNTRLVYLVDPHTAEAFTFSTSSWGGRDAVANLGDQISRMRSVHPDAVPVIELRAAEMPTRFGRKSKPLFKIIGWRTASGDHPASAPAERQISAKQAEQDAARHEMDDQIPF